MPYSSYVQTLASQLALLPQKYVSSLTPPEDNRIHIDLNEMIMYVLRICQKTFVHTINIEVALNESKSWVLADPAQLAQMADNMRAAGVSDAAERIADLVLELADRHTK